MPHWSDKYIGRAYVLESYDCATLAQEIAKNEFGIDAKLPIDHGKNSIGHQRQFIRYQSEIASLIAENELRDGDLVLMISCGRINHVGVYYRDNHIEWVIHNASNVGSVIRTRLRSLSVIGYQIEGFYRWKTR